MIEQSTTISAEPLLDPTIIEAVDFRGRLVQKSSSGGWRSVSFLISAEVAERFAYFGVSSNLISYLTGPLGESTATAAANVNAWYGTALLLTVLGGFMADAFLGRFRTILIGSLIYVLGLGLLTLSALLTSLKTSSSSSPLLKVIFFVSLYLVAVGQGAHKPCLQAFGADQFDGEDPKERKARSAFFNWWYLSLCTGILLSLVIVVYIQDNVSWVLGLGIPCLVMMISLFVFLLGIKTYRFSVIQEEKRNPFARINAVYVAAFRNRASTRNWAEESSRNQSLSGQFKFLNKALVSPDNSVHGLKPSTIADVEEAKASLRIFPIWTTCLTYGIMYAQSTTFFIKQGATMDRQITPGIYIPAASLHIFISISIILFIPIYDRIFIPLARKITKTSYGISTLQRIGAGMVLSIITMVMAALVETKRLKTAEKYGLLDLPDVAIPMSVWWLVPQNLLFGLADVSVIVGMQEFFYDQVSNELRSVGLSLYLSVLGLGSFLSSFLVSAIDKGTGRKEGISWFSSNLNRAHLDYFYWLVAAISSLGFIVFLYFAKSYLYKR